MTVQQAFKKLASARKRSKKIRTEIIDLRQFIIDAGANPDPEKENLLKRNKEIYKKWKRGRPVSEIAEEYNRSTTTIRVICKRIDYILERKGARYKEYKDLLRYYQR
jgi:DNA-binding NarL/FixJ family response regulator